MLIAASFREKKGIPDALRAISRLTDKYRFEITIVGDAGSDAASEREKAIITETIRETGLSEAIKLYGFLNPSELQQIAHSHDIYLAPSKHASDGDNEGGAPVAIIEMAAAGLIIVSTRHCDIPGVVEDVITGWLANESNLDDLTTTLATAIDSRERWAEVSGAARKHVEHHFDAFKQAESLTNHYREVIYGT